MNPEFHDPATDEQLAAPIRSVKDTLRALGIGLALTVGVGIGATSNHYLEKGSVLETRLSQPTPQEMAAAHHDEQIGGFLLVGDGVGAMIAAGIYVAKAQRRIK